MGRVRYVAQVFHNHVALGDWLWRSHVMSCDCFWNERLLVLDMKDTTGCSK